MKVNIDLFMVGAVKCGTTSLYNYLNQHPEVFFSNVKEPNYYSNIESRIKEHYNPPKKNRFYQYKIIKSREIYFSLFDDSESYKIRAEASTSYLWCPEAAKNIYSDFPEAKIIIMLRNPVKRAFSHYLMLRNSGQELEGDFYKALIRDAENELKAWGEGAFLYEDLGLYHKQVETYLKYFKAKNVKVIIFEDFVKNINEGLLEVFEFLEIDKTYIKTIDFTEKHNRYVAHKSKFTKYLLELAARIGDVKSMIPPTLKGRIKGKYLYKEQQKPELSTDAKRYLNEVYADDIAKLEGLLEVDLSAWK